MLASQQPNLSLSPSGPSLNSPNNVYYDLCRDIYIFLLNFYIFGVSVDNINDLFFNTSCVNFFIVSTSFELCEMPTFDYFCPI